MLGNLSTPQPPPDRFVRVWCAPQRDKGTWKSDEERVELGFAWSVPVLSDDVQFVATCDAAVEVEPRKLIEEMFLFMASVKIEKSLPTEHMCPRTLMGCFVLI